MCMTILVAICFFLFLGEMASESVCTSSTRPNPPTPSVATTSMWSSGLDDEKAAVICFRRSTSGGNV